MISSVKSGYDYDAIIIGSGMGGLATGSLLAQIGGKRVLVLESHFKLGGFLHSFRRKDYVWDPGVHYIGEMHDGSLNRKCMDLVTGGSVQWYPMKKLERIIFPDGQCDVPSDPKAYQLHLIDRFPEEATSIRRYFRDVNSVQGWSHRWFYSRQFAEPVASLISLGRGVATKTTQEYLDKYFRDPLLKAFLTAQWGDYGTPPSESAFGIHAIVAADFQRGGFYPIGGSQRIADAAADIIRAKGGLCLASHPVQEILVEQNQAVGVRVIHKGQELTFRAPQIVSNAGVATTFNRLLPPTAGKRERARLKSSEPGPSAAILYLGLNDDPRSHGFEDCNYWIFDRTDYGQPEHRRFGGVFLSFGSIRNPGQVPHTAQIITFSNKDTWGEFDGRSWQKRGEDYQARKDEWATELIDFAEERLPGLKSLIAYQELSSPLTVESFTGHPGGQIYGRSCSPARLSDSQFGIQTSVGGLYLTGCDVTVPGVNAALMTGVMTAGKMLGSLTGIPRIFWQAFRR